MTTLLEQFLRDYTEAADGVWDEIEPQVYDVLWSEQEAPLRLTFDPEALPEHPTAQLLTFGLPLLDDLLAAAHVRGQMAQVYYDALNLQPYRLEQQVQRDLSVPAGTTLELAPPRASYVAHTIFWFEASYLGDEKTQAILSAALDRHYGRLVRHLDPLLSEEGLSEERRWPFPDATALPLTDAYHLARERVVRSVIVEANSQQRFRQSQATREIARMERYFADMAEELKERMAKAQAKGEAIAPLQQRQAALEREAATRIDELRRKAGVRAQLRLRNILTLHIPRFFLRAHLQGPKLPSTPELKASWDPLTEKTDALACPRCTQPTYALLFERRMGLHCPACEAAV
ncbi:MAG: hypothetical protein EI684_21315 [Candidatus Viridilinea halotolerans]|uniref:Uncharacterized protein n=1 Tax=Candidatus Viridilinea halotolerans TaxID=2491704 RepID=A0A426TRI0_9CHLR|nr:MAG: hypothetical protein EI684_21315 [Candidatus Viridilinea halotolerans]